MEDEPIQQSESVDEPPAGVSAQDEGAAAIGARSVHVTGDVDGNIHTGDIYNYFIDGTQRYRPEFTTAIKNFLYNYLGDEKNPVPFGGREEAWQQLEQWRVQADAPPRLLLTAPAGRGKSALLVRWSAHLQHQPNVAVVFMPISIRFNTNQEEATFSLLATRLAHFYGKEIPTGWGNFPSSAWRRLVAEYLQEPLPGGRQLLVILDGLDEAAWQPGADLFPHQLPERVRLLLSARDRGGEEPGPAPWLRQLGWDRFAQMAATMDLQSLTPAGVRDVLEKMGCPLDELGRNVDIVAELHRLSLGDPLLVELYVKDLWGRGQEVVRLQPEDLHSIAPGYKGYFENWMADQRKLWGREDPLAESLVMDILDVLAVALGPLRMGDLRQLLPEPARGREVKQAIRHLSRFVIGDGQEQGYALAHPKLGEYFRDGLDEEEQIALQQRFLAWGARVLGDLQAGQLKPREVPSYLMQYYGRHLEGAEATAEELLPLVSQEWSQVWYEKTGTYAGFLQDIERVWAILQAEDKAAAARGQVAPYLGQEILCALCRASVNSLAANLSDELLVALLQAGLWTAEQVLVYIRQRQDAEKRSWGFIRLVPQLPAARQPALWLEALVAARQIEQEGIRAMVLAAVAPYLPEDVLEAALELQDEWSRSQVLATVALYLPEKEKVLAAVQELQDEVSRASVLAALAPYLTEAARLAVQVEALAAGRQDKWNHTEVLVALAPHWPEDVWEAARELQDEESRAKVLAAVAPYRPEEVVAAARELQDEWRRAEVLAAVAPHRPESVLVAAREMSEDVWGRCAEVLVALAPYRPEEVLAAARELQDKEGRARVLTVVAPYLVEAERPTVLFEALAAARELQDEGSRAEVLAAVAPYWPEEVVAAAQGLQDEGRRAKVLAAVAPYQPEKVLAAAQELQDEGRRAEVLAALAPHRPEDVLAAARGLQDKEMRTRVLAAVAPYVVEAERPSVLFEALAAAQELPDEWRRARALVATAPYWPEEVLAATWELKNEWRRAEVLAAVAPYRPEKVLAAAQVLQDEGRRVEALAAVAPHQPKEVLAAARELQDKEGCTRVLTAVAPYRPQEVRAATRELKNREERARVLAALAPHLVEAERQAVLAEALAATCELKNDWRGSRAAVLAAFATYRPEEVLAATQELQDEWRRAEVLAAVAPHQPEEVLVAARELQGGESRAEVLAAVAPYQPEEVLVAARELQDKDWRTKVLAAAAPHLAEVKHTAELYAFWHETLSILSWRTRPHLLSDLAALMPVIHKLGGDKGVADMLDAVQKVSTWWP